MSYQLRLLDKCRRVHAEVVEHAHGGVSAALALALARHQQRVDERLGVVPPDPRQQAMYQIPNAGIGRVYARDDLQLTP